LSRLLKYLKPYTLAIIGIFILVYIQVLTDLQLPDYMAKIINLGIVGKDTAVIWHNGGLMLLVSVLGAVCTVAYGYIAVKVATGFSKTIREDVFARVESFSLREFDKFSTASLITRSTNDIQQIQMVLVMFLRMVLAAPILGVGAVFKAYAKAPNMSWIIGLAVAVLFGMFIVLFTVAVPKFKMLQKLVDRLNLVTRENLTGLRVIRAFNTEEPEKVKFERANRDLTDLNLFVNRLMVIMQPLMMMILNVVSIMIVWVGAHEIGAGDLQIGDMIAFMQYAMQVIFAFLMVSIIFIMVPRAAVSAGRVADVIETEPLIRDPKDPKKYSKDVKGIVEFDNVTFSYPEADSPVLCDISFTAKAGETTAIIGSTGSGKSTLINLIPRFYDVTGGRVLIDGLDVREVTKEDLCDKIGFVPQKGVLFTGTVDSNIKFGNPDASDAEVKKAAETAQAYDFVMELDEQFSTPIAQGGANVSGGQKQRLAIARAIIKKPEIYIFDDSFSALDFATDAALRNALSAETKNATVLIVAQRISTIMNADKIIVLDEGRIAGMGKHEDLIKSNPVYIEIATSQLSDEELAI
jgi:ATP-binding cassette, subfamily B, multidrug efflux pump